VELFSGYRGGVDTGLSGKNTEKEIIPGEGYSCSTQRPGGSFLMVRTQVR